MSGGDVLHPATAAVTLFAMTTTLWMAFYLLARGFPSLITLRMVVLLLALSGFYFGSYNNIFHQIPDTAAIRAELLVIGLACWYSITFQLMSEDNRRRYRWIERGMYILGITAIFLLLKTRSFINEEGNDIYVAHMDTSGWAYRVYGGFQLIVSAGIMLNLLVGDRVGLTPRGKYFLVTSIFPVASVLYGVISLGSPVSSPRIIQDSLAFCGVFILSLAVARHQIWMERRATREDFPLTTAVAVGLAALSGLVAWLAGMQTANLSMVVGLTVIIIGVYDLTREFLERRRMYDEGLLRKQLRRLERDNAGEDDLKSRLEDGLGLLCNNLQAPGGFVAIRQGEEFRVVASRSSVPAGSAMSVSMVACEDVSHPAAEQLSSIAWIAPSFEGRLQVAVVGIEKSIARMEYSNGQLELLAEVADQIGTIVSLGNMTAKRDPSPDGLAMESQAKVKDLRFVTGEMLDSLSTQTDAEFIKIVEDALRHLPDTITLAQSPLAEKVSIAGDSNLDRGKRLQEFLMEAIAALKPDEKRPPEPLPRIWYNHAVLHDAYVEGVPNREIMARLYISEGTFNRTRRNAIRGLARTLIEK